MRIKSTLIVVFLTQGVSAQESGLASAYSFGGSCASQGVWTQTALSATQSLRKVTLQLKDDANCKALGNSVQLSIENLENSLRSVSDTPSRITRLSNLPQEISALRGFINSAPDMKQQVLRVMMDKSIESATLAAQVDQSTALMANGISDFGTRLQRGTRTGLSMLNQVVDSIPLLDQCLTGDGQQALGSFISTAVQVASSFASSGQDMTGSQMATTVSKLTNLVREKKYSAVMRKLNQQEFMASMACLMEVTSESYCQARDGMRLFQKGMTDLKFKQDSKMNMKSNNPFVGYYVLNTHVPNITKWLQKIQIGVDPKLPTDAVFQNKIQQEVTDFYMGVKTLLGDYNSALLTIKSLPTVEARQNAVLKLLFKVTESMSSGGSRSYGDGDKTNFFTMSKNSLRIPFELVGLPVPDQVSGKVMPKLRYDEWFQANMSDLPIFKDPMALSETIGQNMQSIIRGANLSAIEYFNKWYIVDKAALVNESTIDINYTVQDSLVAINEYLEAEKGRIQKYNGNSGIVPTIVDTQIKIRKILDAYEGLESLGRKALADKNSLKQTVEQVQQTADAYEKLVTTVYEQFNVMQSRSGFLANRMVNFVYQDYVLLVKNKVDFTAYQEELFTSTGMAGVDRMLQMYNGNPANIQTDLNMALRINKGNIEALEDLLKDNVVGTIAELNRVKNGDQGSTTWNSLKRAILDRFRDPKEKRWYDATILIPNPIILLAQAPKVGLYWFKHMERYPLGRNNSSISPQSEFDDAGAVQAQLCIQALAFNDQSPLLGLCNQAILKSPLGQDLKGMSVAYSEKLKVHLQDKGTSEQMKRSLNHSERICAFRDYNIRNMAKFMSLSKGSLQAQ